MHKLNIDLGNGINLLHSEERKARHFLSNTITEYRIGYYLWKYLKEAPSFTLDVSLHQNQGDFSIGNKHYELKENKGALSSSALSFEVLNTQTCEISGLCRSYKDNVHYFLVYLSAYNNYQGKYTSLVDNLVMFDTDELYMWMKNNEDLKAKNNNYKKSNALCYKVPVSYLLDCGSLRKTIVEQIHLPESELQKINIPSEVYALFENE